MYVKKGMNKKGAVCRRQTAPQSFSFNSKLLPQALCKVHVKMFLREQEV